MPIDLVPVPLADKAELARMMHDYMVEMAAILSIAVRTYPQFDRYWTEPGQRWPYWIVSEGEHVGFALVSRDPHRDTHEIAEFFVGPAHRRRGVGTDAARAIVRRHPGRWRIVQRERNVNAIAFWHRVLEGYSYQEVATVTDVGRREQSFIS